jgi:hypothetical protein
MSLGKQVTLAGIVLLALAAGLAGEGPDEEKTKALMHKKLENAQKVLEGVAMRDFSLISKHAEELMLLSQQAEWHVLKTPRYDVCSNEFRRSVEDLIHKAKEKNIDGAALSYVEMTLACVKCHKYVREAGMTRLDERGIFGNDKLQSELRGKLPSLSLSTHKRGGYN